MRWAVDSVAETTGRALPDLTDRMLWGELIAGSRSVAEAFAAAARLWQDAVEGMGGHGVAMLATTLVLSAGVFLVWRWALPAWEARREARWHGAALAISLPAFAGVILLGCATWLAASLLLQVFLAAAPDIPALRATARMLVAIATLIAVLLATARGVRRVVAGGQGAPGTPTGFGVAPVVLSVALLLVALLDQHAALVPQDVALIGFVQVVSASVLVAAIALLLSRVSRMLAAAAEWAPTRGRATQLVRVGVLIGWLLVVVIVFSLLTGYAALAAFLAKQVVWSLIVLAWLFLAWRMVGDAVSFLTGRRETLMGASHRLGIGTRRLQQAVVLAGGVLMLAVACIALMLVSAPYGVGPGDLLGRVFDAGGRLRIGNLSFSPVQLLRAVFVLVVAVVVARMLARWLSCRLLPTTRLDAGVQASLTTLVGYLGVIVGIGMALAALGVEANRITWIVSALTVGVGFGLQAIVQNFISGLILLVERPVKVGDWVVVGDAEGDVRRINVRATEIALADRTTVLVPNSELITKVVRNRTFTAGDGLVKVVLPVPATANMEQVIGLVEAVVREQRDLKASPAPQVQMEDVKDNKLWIGISAYVDGPRQVTRIRAALLYAVVQRLQANGVALA